MKKNKHYPIQLNKLLFLIALLMSAATAMPQTAFVVNGIRYDFNEGHWEYDEETGEEYYVESDGTLQVVEYVDVDENYNYYHHYKGDIVIPSSVTYNGITYSVTVIAPYAFSNCTSLRSVTIPNSVTTIGSDWNDVDTGCAGAFMFCTGLEEITIGKSVNFIGTCTFRLGYENNLKKVTCLATTPPETVWGFSGEQRPPRTPIGIFDDYYGGGIGENSWVGIYDNIYHQATLYVPKGSVEAYRNADDWGRFVSIVGIDVPEEQVVHADVNGDGVVNISDLNNVVNDILSGKGDPSMDVNGDGSVNISDINLIVQTILTAN